MNTLLENLSKMSKPEIYALSKNRWIPARLQMAIAKLPFSRSRQYLASNEGLDVATRDYLWSDECSSGYSHKASMIAAGHYLKEPDKYREFYERYGNNWDRSYWRMPDMFFGNYFYDGTPRPAGSAGTPSDLLNRIYDEKYDLKRASSRNLNIRWMYPVRNLARHQNVDLELAIKLSISDDERIKSLAFKKIVELSK